MRKKLMMAIVAMAMMFGGCQILRRAPETGEYDIDWELAGELIEVVIDSDRLTLEERIEALERLRGVSTHEGFQARIDREIARIRERMEDREEPDPDDPDPPGDDEFPDDVTWLHTDVSGWPVTGNLGEVRVGGGLIRLPYDKANVWPGRHTAGAHVNANPWIIARVDGQWYAATWEWMRVGQTAKAVSAVAGDHIKRAPFGDNWRPTSGEPYGFMVSGLARTNVRNVQERTNVVWVVWP